MITWVLLYLLAGALFTIALIRSGQALKRPEFYSVPNGAMVVLIILWPLWAAYLVLSIIGTFFLHLIRYLSGV